VKRILAFCALSATCMCLLAGWKLTVQLGLVVGMVVGILGASVVAMDKWGGPT